MGTIKVTYDEMKSEFRRILIKAKLTPEKAQKCAEIFATNSLEGIYSHGVYRFPRFIEYIQKNYIDVHAEPEEIHSIGAMEQWDGNLGPGPLNAEVCTDRAMELASEHGIGCVAIRNTNHWMRGGYYGWEAAKKGFIFIGWTNTIANMPAWGAKDVHLGNNPLVFAVPYNNEAIVLDFAMTQFSYGKMEELVVKEKDLPFAGGYNKHGNLTNNPKEILETNRALPIGYWKGAGLSLLLDILASILSAGLATHQISKLKSEHSVSQVFIAIDIKKLQNFPAIDNSVSEIIRDLKKSISEDETQKTRHPGERVVQTKKENLEDGIPVDKNVWEEITRL